MHFWKMHVGSDGHEDIGNVVLKFIPEWLAVIEYNSVHIYTAIWTYTVHFYLWGRKLHSGWHL